MHRSEDYEGTLISQAEQRPVSHLVPILPRPPLGEFISLDFVKFTLKPHLDLEPWEKDGSQWVPVSVQAPKCPGPQSALKMEESQPLRLSVQFPI